VAQASLYALGSVLGDSSTEGLQAGNGLIGLVAVGLRVATKIGLPPTPAMRTFCLAGVAILLASLFAFVALMRDPAVKAKIDAHEHRRAARLAGGRANSVDGMGAPVDEDYVAFEEGEGQWGSLDYSGGGIGEGAASPQPPKVTVTSALARCAVETACAFLVFLICLSTFPGLTTSLVSSTWRLGDWFPLALVAAYNTADLVGKSLPARLRLLDSASLPLVTLAHTLFLPAFAWLAHPTWPPLALRSDATAVGLVAALGLCTGYIGCSALVLGSERGRTPEEREVIGQITSFGLMMGLSTGSIAGILLSQLF